jgi:hypothetical protein
MHMTTIPRFFQAIFDCFTSIGAILDRGSSTTKTCQAVPTREYQSDLPSLHAPRVLSKGFKQKSDNIKLITSIDSLIHIRSLSDLGNRRKGKSF